MMSEFNITNGEFQFVTPGRYQAVFQAGGLTFELDHDVDELVLRTIMLGRSDAEPIPAPAPVISVMNYTPTLFDDIATTGVWSHQSLPMMSTQFAWNPTSLLLGPGPRLPDVRRGDRAYALRREVANGTDIVIAGVSPFDVQPGNPLGTINGIPDIVPLDSAASFMIDNTAAFARLRVTNADFVDSSADWRVLAVPYLDPSLPGHELAAPFGPGIVDGERALSFSQSVLKLTCVRPAVSRRRANADDGKSIDEDRQQRHALRARRNGDRATRAVSRHRDPHQRSRTVERFRDDSAAPARLRRYRV
jgi:hypothetical protein